MRRDYVNAGILWFVLTVIGLLLVPYAREGVIPFLASEEGILIDEAFEFLLIMAVPVMSFVLAVLGYSVFRFREREGAEPSLNTTGNNGVYLVWIVVTGLLAIAILIHPGITGLAELRSNPSADLEITVTAEKWNWDFTYEDYDVTLLGASELVLPVDTRVKFEVTSLDILHSFWVPAFRMKIDAVPGQTTVLYVTPAVTGTFDDDIGMRVQCAELCGSGHARMRTTVVVLEQEAFEDWIASQARASSQEVAGRGP